MTAALSSFSSFFSRPGSLPGRPWRYLLFGLGCLLVIAVLISSFGQSNASLRALGKLQAQSERIGRLDSLLIQLADAESSVRGYLLSRNREYLEPYEASLATLHYTLDDIRADLATSPESDAILADLSGLVTLKMRILADAVRRGSVSEEAPKGSSAPAEGKRYMDRIRDTLAEIKRRELIEGQRSLESSVLYFHRTQWVVATLAGAAFLLLLMLYFVLQRQLQLREQIADLLRGENQRLDALVQERTDELSHLASYLTNAREAEQARLARELHDELGSLLTAAKMDTSWIVRQLAPDTPPAIRERLERLQDELHNGILLKRRLIDDLRPPLLKELGLVAALRALAEDFAKSSECRLVLDLPADDLELPRDQALALFRIAQEGLTNIRKYAAAHTVKIGLATAGGRAILRIEDDGRGFDPALAGKRRHGLAGMRHRVQMFAGDFSLESRPGHGTRIVAGIPLAEAALVQ
ncbi:MAG TPA: CHASE3 domain-containing protein [Rhodocyclaceae bacterium]|nr:CHASE3 domain-containing protein [Rhodocyclaceae bacterium]